MPEDVWYSAGFERFGRLAQAKSAGEMVVVVRQVERKVEGRNPVPRA